MNQTDVNLSQLDSNAVNFLTSFDYNMCEPGFISAQGCQPLMSSSLMEMGLDPIVSKQPLSSLENLFDQTSQEAVFQTQDQGIPFEDEKKKNQKRGGKRKPKAEAEAEITVQKRVSKPRKPKESVSGKKKMVNQTKVVSSVVSKEVNEEVIEEGDMLVEKVKEKK